MDQLGSAVAALAAGKTGALRRVLRLGRALHDELAEQIELEREILVPALREADAWGSTRADRLSSRHAVRSRELVGLRGSCSRGDPHAIGRELRTFIEERWTDMARAERSILCSGVLRDDILGIDVEGG